jgi:hypothetical protein
MEYPDVERGGGRWEDRQIVKLAKRHDEMFSNGVG